MLFAQIHSKSQIRESKSGAIRYTTLTFLTVWPVSATQIAQKMHRKSLSGSALHLAITLKLSLNLENI